MFSQLSQPHFILPTCSGLRFLASEATDPEHRDASVLVPCFLMPQKFVIDFVEIVTEIENSVELKIHGVLSDACTPDNCCVTNDPLRISLAS